MKIEVKQLYLTKDYMATVNGIYCSVSADRMEAIAKAIKHMEESEGITTKLSHGYIKMTLVKGPSKVANEKWFPILKGEEL